MRKILWRHLRIKSRRDYDDARAEYERQKTKKPVNKILHENSRVKIMKPQQN